MADIGTKDKTETPHASRLFELGGQQQILAESLVEAILSHYDQIFGFCRCQNLSGEKNLALSFSACHPH